MKKYTYFIYKKHEKTLESDEEKKLTHWLEKNQDNRKYSERLQTILKESRDIELPVFTETESCWQSIQNEILKQSSKKDYYYLIRSVADLFHKRTLIYAAIFILCLVVGYSIFNIILNPYRSIVAEKGERNSFILSDGSSILLNSDSKIFISKTYGTEHRMIRLSGEAFFNVLPSEKPFIVKTQNSVTTVIGTSFNIWARGKETRIIVQEGKVKFNSNVIDEKPLILEKGQMSCIIDDNKPLTPEYVDLNEKLGWIKGDLIFKKTPLSEVAGELERFYKIKIKFSSPDLREKTITATIHRLSADQAIRSICKTLEIKYKKKGNTYILYNGIK